LLQDVTAIGLFCLVLVGATLAQSAADFPRIHGETFSGRKIDLPDAAFGKVDVLIFGFSKASGGPTGAWAKKINADFGNDKGFELYQLPVLEDVPRFIRGMVISGIKKGVPENARDHFVPVLQGEAALKKAVNYSQPDDAYIVILNREGKVVEQFHGPQNDANYARVREQLALLLK
jgi:hypothetical protein